MTSPHEVVGPSELWGAWTFDPIIVVALGAAGILYARGAARLSPAARRSPARAAAFYGALAAVALALISPLDAAAHALFSAHMVQHLILVVVAPPLLAFGSPVVPLLRGAPAWVAATLRRIERVPAIALASRAARNPVVAAAAHVAALWIWHLPGPYQAAVAQPVWHALEHASLFGTALLFWAVVFDRSVSYGVRMSATFGVALGSGALGAILAFSSVPLYPIHAAGSTAWGVDLVVDQQLAGAVMWVPGGVAYLVTMSTLFLRWLRSADERVAGRPTTEVRP